MSQALKTPPLRRTFEYALSERFAIQSAIRLDYLLAKIPHDSAINGRSLPSLPTRHIIKGQSGRA
jgi:hypothetical protein